jgi:hypothetical protein
MGEHPSAPGVEMAVDALATFRLTRLVTQDWITDPARQQIKARYGPAAYDFVTCPWCVSIWLAAAVLTARRLAPRAWSLAAAGLAASATAGFLAERS